MERPTEEPDLLANAITCNGRWIFQYGPDTKRQSLHCKSPTSPRIEKSANEQVKTYFLFKYV